MLVCVGDLVEQVLVGLPGDPVRGGETAVRAGRVRGGSAANVAALDAEAGGRSRFVGQVGDDDVGRRLVEDLNRRGVETAVTYRGVTGLVVTMIGPDWQSRLVDRGAARRLESIDAGVLDGARQLYLPASVFSEDPLATAVEGLLGEVADRRIAVTLGGPGPAEIDSIGGSAFLELVRTIAPDAVVLDRRGHAALDLGARTGLPGATVTVVTERDRPTLVIPSGGPAASVGVPPVDVIRDRTGAGDGFLAGFLGSRGAGADPVAATRAGHRLAARVLARLGPTSI